MNENIVIFESAISLLLIFLFIYLFLIKRDIQKIINQLADFKKLKETEEKEFIENKEKEIEPISIDNKALSEQKTQIVEQKTIQKQILDKEERLISIDSSDKALIEQKPQKLEEKYEDTLQVSINKASRKYFIFIKDIDDESSKYITPEGRIKILEKKLFEDFFEENESRLLSQNRISELQANTYYEYISDLSESEDMSDFQNVQNQPAIKRLRMSGPLTQDDLIPTLIMILGSLGGQVNKYVVDKIMFKLFQNEFSQPFYRELIAHGIPRWKHNIAWAKERARQLHGYIKSATEAGHGIWELTEGGVRYYKLLKERNFRVDVITK